MVGVTQLLHPRKTDGKRKKKNYGRSLSQTYECDDEQAVPKDFPLCVTIAGLN